MSAPRWARLLIWLLAPKSAAADQLGDLEEQYRRGVSTTIDTLDIAAALLRARLSALTIIGGNALVQDYRLGLRMLRKYPGLTLAGGFALALAIGLGAGWFDLSRDLFRPIVPLPGGDRLIEIEVRDAVGNQNERRLLHDFAAWRSGLQSVQDLGAYRSLERGLTTVASAARPEPIAIAETTASAFRAASVAPLLGRPLIDADERPGATPVLVMGYSVWQRQFGGRADIVGTTVHVGKTPTTVVGVMPEGFAFPVNHRLWIPLQMPAAGYTPLEGPAVRVFGRLAPGATASQALAEVTTLVQREAAASPRTHERLRPRVLAYGGQSATRPIAALTLTHVPVLLVLIIACVNVGTLIYARIATREAEISTRYALGASRGRILTQLFVEALVLALFAAVLGLIAADRALKFGVTMYYAGQNGAMPFWIRPGLRLSTVFYAAGLTVLAAAILGVLPGLKATGARAYAELRNLGGRGSTLRFGWVWTTVMIAQVALTVICIPPAMGISSEALRDRRIRSRFPTNEYLAARLALDARMEEPTAALHQRREQAYAELARRVAAEPAVRAVTFGDRLPGMVPAVQHGEVEAADRTAPIDIPNLWTTAVAPGYFEAFGVPIVAGRAFHDGDRIPAARAVLVNEAFARQFLNGGNPVGRRVRFAADGQGTPEPWLEIVGMVRDVGMTPTDAGEAPYVFRAVRAGDLDATVIGIRAGSDPAALAPRLRELAAGIDSDLRVDEVRTLDDFTWRVDLPQLVAAGALAAIVAAGLFLSAGGIFSLMAVSVARRTREIGLRLALGASPGRLLGAIFARALALVGGGIGSGIAVLMLVTALSPEINALDIAGVLAATAALMLIVGVLACVEPARRALRIAPTDALKES